MIAWSTAKADAAIVAGVRTPFAKAGTALCDIHITDLARAAFAEALYHADWSPARLDEVILGNVVMPADAVNPARAAALWAGIPERIPALTVQRNCASGLEALADAAARIQSHEARAILAGGAESMSTIPLMLPAAALEPVGQFARAGSPWKKAAALTHLRPRHFRPIAGLELGLTDPTCGLIMGQTAEILAQEFAITRVQQDQFALQSHQRATAAAAAGRLNEEIVPFYAGRRFSPITADNGPRPQQSLEALAKLRTRFDTRDGSVTVGNSCQVTDGAAALLLLDPELARAEGHTPLGYIRGYAHVGLDPAHMGLGPVLAIDRLLRQTGTAFSDIALFEINEAFAAQVLACLKAMASARFAREHLDRDIALGELDPDRLNVNGGAIALGHPVGATGTRLVLTLLLEMRRRKVELGIAALCVGGGQGAAMLLQAA
jgi:acetyl-CoA acetyltransferase family protein